jgi:ATP/maltotriose-dependent transcriptional regulator MalT
MATLTGGEFVGRQQEMGKLKGALEDALSGRGQLLMLVGEPGIGKTRTAQELAVHAETRGAQVLWGWCFEEEGAPPFWPWVQPIRAYVQERGSEQLQSEMGPGAADIAEVVSEVRGKLPSLEPPLALPPEQARFRLFDSITTFLKKAAQSQPLMLVLDDLHWADKPSLLLLQFLARQLGESHLLVLGCYRDMELSRQHPLSESLAQLSRLPVFQRELLLGMSREDSGQFIEMTAGVRPSPQLVETIYARTEGNPFFTAEVVRLLSERGALQDSAGLEAVASALPVGVLEVIGRRLNRLSSQCHQTLTTAAVIGREFDFRLLNLLSERTSEEQLLDVIDEGLEAHLIEEMPEGRERYQFCHALIQETLTQQLSSSRKVRQHARIAQALEELYGANAEAHAAELAYHFAQAEPVLGHQKLVYYSLLAGEGELKTYAYEEALIHFQRGLVAKEDHPRDAEIAALLFGLARVRLAMNQRGMVQEVLSNLSRAFDYYAEVNDVPNAVAVAGCPLPNWTGHLPGMAQLVGRALELVPADSAGAGHLLSLYGRFLGAEEGDYAGAQEAFGRALVIAQRQGDVALEMRTLGYAGRVGNMHFLWQEGLVKSLEALELASRVDDPRTELDAHHVAIMALAAMGGLEEIPRHASAMLPLAERMRDHYWLSAAFELHVVVSCMKGDWSTARDFSDRGLRWGAESGPRPTIFRALLEYQLGDFEQGYVYLEQLLESMRRFPPGPILVYVLAAMTIGVIGRITGVASKFDIAEAAARAIISSPSAAPQFALQARAGLALLAVQRGDVAVARELYNTLEAIQNTTLQGVIVGDRLLGLVAQAAGNLDQATVHFEDALAFCRKAGCLPELAWTYHDYADTLLQRNNPGDREKALSLLDETLTISQQLGMRPLMERVVALQEHAEAQPVKTPAYPDGLTQREVEVLRLVASGQSSAEIAAELVLSRRTVERHISNIYSKTNTHNRSEATAFAFTHGLIPTG